MVKKIVKQFSKRTRCPAKINFGLMIPYRYPNGYHHIISALIPLDLCDEITVEVNINEPEPFSINPSYYKESTSEISNQSSSSSKADLLETSDSVVFSKHESTLETSERISFTWQNDLPRNLTNQNDHTSIFEEKFEKNIVTKAYRWFRQSPFLNNTEEANSIEVNSNEFQKVRSILQAPWDTRLHIIKRVPSPAGLGGGSSDAAGVLKSCLAILQTLLPDAEFNAYKTLLLKNCMSLGADIPFFMQEQPAIVSGIGEILSSFALPLPLLGICCVPDFGFSTKEMYESLSRPTMTEVNTTSPGIGEFNNSVSSKDLKDSPKGTPKKTLQGDDLMLHNLSYGPNLIRDIISGFSKDYPDFLNQVGSKNTLVNNAKERVFTIENEFVEVSRELFPQKSRYIDIIQEKLTELVNLELAKRKIAKPAFSSMSGSGSSIYTVMFLNKDDAAEMKQGLNDILKSLRNLYPDCYCTMICSK